MERQRPLTGKIALSSKEILKAGVAYSFSVVAVIVAMLIKFWITPNLEFTRPVFSFVMMSAGLAFIMMSYFFYATQSRRSIVASYKNLASLGAAMALSYIVTIFMSQISIIIMPVSLAAFIIAPLARRRDAFVCSLFTTFMVFYTLFLQSRHSGGALLFDIVLMMAVNIVAGTAVAYKVSENAKRSSYIIKGFIIATLSLCGILLGELTTIASTDEFTLSLGFAAAAVYAPIFIGLITQPLFELVFNLVTNARLVEFTDHNSPLIKRLRTETPGTFNHCLAVASFAEICATAIGENAYQARACAYYHDVGKLANAEYYKENQGEHNPHDELLPEVSAEIIRAHTTEGYKLCEQYRIPYEISHVTIQHHGTLLIPVFYKKAQQLTDGEVNRDEYSYHGTTPVTKIAAIIMLCDVAEAAIRAMDAPDGEKVDKLLSSLITDRINAGQFDNCDISLRELDAVKKAIISAYGGMFHKRMKYPDAKK